MSLLTKKDFAEKCGMSHTNLFPEWKRGKIVYTPDPNNPNKELVDTDDQVNKLYLEKRKKFLEGDAQTKNKSNPIGNPKSKQESKQDFDFGIEDEKPKENKKRKSTEDSDSLLDLEIEEKKLKIDVLGREIVKRDIDIEKKMGDVIPIELVQNLIISYARSIAIEMKNSHNDFITYIGALHDLDPKEIAGARLNAIDRLNHAIQTAGDAVKKDIKSIVSEFSEKKGRGEKK